MNDPPVSRSSDSSNALSIDGWQVDASTLRISKDGKSEKLEPRSMGVLMYLASRPGETIPRGDDAGAYAYRIAESYFLLGKYEEAEIEFQEYRRRTGDNYYSCMMLAGVYAQLGRLEEARVHLDKFNEERAKKGRTPPHASSVRQMAVRAERSEALCRKPA